MTRLSELRARFIRMNENGYLMPVNEASEAQGIAFLCPRCYDINYRTWIGTHYVVCWFEGRGAPEVTAEKWSPLYGPDVKVVNWARTSKRQIKTQPCTVSGTGIEDLTLLEEVKVAIPAGCHCEFTIKNGETSI